MRLVNVINHCSFLAKRGVKEDIQNFDARKISPDIRKNVEAFLKKNAGSFEPKVGAHFLQYSLAKCFLCRLKMGSMETYYAVYI